MLQIIAESLLRLGMRFGLVHSGIRMKEELLRGLMLHFCRFVCTVGAVVSWFVVYYSYPRVI